MPGRPHRPLPRLSTCRHATRRCAQIAYDTEHFSSRRIIVRDVRPESPRSAAPPITSDPPVHKPAQAVLLPPFTPDAMKKLEPRARAICNELIDGFIADGELRRRGATTPSTSRCASSPTCSASPRATATSSSQVDPRRSSSSASRDDEHADAGGQRDDATTSRGHIEARTSKPERRPDQLPAERQGPGRPAARRTTTCWARCGCC